MANLREWKFSEAQRCVDPLNAIVGRAAVRRGTLNQRRRPGKAAIEEVFAVVALLEAANI
jgi:hypothetical protein